MQVQQVVIIRQLLEILYPDFVLETESYVANDSPESKVWYYIFFHDRNQGRETGMIWPFPANMINPDDSAKFIADCYMKVLLAMIEHKAREQNQNNLSIVN